MKYFLFFFLILNARAYADEALDRYKICEGFSDCRMVISQVDLASKNGTCSGLFDESIPCTLSLSAGMSRFSCGADPAKPIFSQIIVSDTLAYNVSAIITNTEGDEELIEDPRSYISINNSLVEVSIVEVAGKMEASMAMVMRDELKVLSNVQCITSEFGL